MYLNFFHFNLPSFTCIFFFIIIVISKKKLRPSESVVPTTEDPEEQYKMTAVPRGYAVIINNQHFIPRSLPERKGMQ